MCHALIVLFLYLKFEDEVIFRLWSALIIDFIYHDGYYWSDYDTNSISNYDNYNNNYYNNNSNKGTCEEIDVSPV